jgi:hypothetical protein
LQPAKWIFGQRQVGGVVGLQPPNNLIFPVACAGKAGAVDRKNKIIGGLAALQNNQQTLAETPF